MNDKDFARNLKIKGALVESSIILLILGILAGMITGTYFIIKESSKDSSLRYRSSAIYEALKDISEKERSTLSLSNDGLLVLDIDELNNRLNERLNSSYKLVNVLPKTIESTLVVLNEYDEFYSRYKSFLFIDPSINNRYSKTSFIDGNTSIIGQ